MVASICFLCSSSFSYCSLRRSSLAPNVDVEIGVNGSYTLRHAHEIAEEVHEGIEKNFPKVKHVMVHVNPADVAE